MYNNVKGFSEFILENKYSQLERESLSKKGKALPDGSFPIVNKNDLKNAIQTYGRSKNQSATAKFIAKRAKELGAEDLILNTNDKILLEIYKKEYELNLKEGLIKSAPIGETVFILKKQFTDWIFQYEKGDKDFTIEILKLKNGIQLKYFEKLLPLLNNLGYFISYVEIYGDNISIKDKYNEKTTKNAFQNSKIHSIYLECESKFDQMVNKIPKFLYHITPLKNWEKIQKIGLAPKSRSKKAYHPERVYLGKNEKNTSTLAFDFYQIVGIKAWVLLKINTSMIPGNYLRLYKDPNYEYGYYTLNNIPPQAIKKVKEIYL